MNLNAIAARYTRAVTPAVAGQLYMSDGYTTDAAGARTPKYQAANVTADVQAATGGDLKYLDGIGIQGVTSVAYLNGEVQGLNRAERKGGDILRLDRDYFLVVAVMENWTRPGWTKVAITQQVTTPAGLPTP